MAAGPDLSVVLATAHPGEPLDALLARLLPQLAGIRGELVFVDGSDAGLPTPAHPGLPIVHLHRPGADVFTMRADGAAQATGWVVAFAEDHCMPADETWARSVLEAHVVHGDRAAVTGAVSNGTDDSLWDRGSFLLTFSPVLDPLAREQRLGRVPPPANLSIKREVLSGHQLTPGFVEFELAPHLFAVDHVALAPAARMEHHQAHRPSWFLVHHFHNGRTTGGLVRREGGLLQAVRRLLQSGALIPALTWSTAREILRRPTGRRAGLAAVPIVTALLAAHAVGQAVGIVLGAGDSPRELE